MTFKEWEKQAVYTPLHNFYSCGTNIQVSSLDLPHNVRMIERTYFPWSVFKNASTYWALDLVLPLSEVVGVKNFHGELNTDYYTEEGYGYPEFTSIEHAFEFNEWYNLNKKS